MGASCPAHMLHAVPASSSTLFSTPAVLRAAPGGQTTAGCIWRGASGRRRSRLLLALRVLPRPGSIRYFLLITSPTYPPTAALFPRPTVGPAGLRRGPLPTSPALQPR